MRTRIRKIFIVLIVSSFVFELPMTTTANVYFIAKSVKFLSSCSKGTEKVTKGIFVTSYFYQKNFREPNSNSQTEEQSVEEKRKDLRKSLSSLSDFLEFSYGIDIDSFKDFFKDLFGIKSNNIVPATANGIRIINKHNQNDDPTPIKPNHTPLPDKTHFKYENTYLKNLEISH